MLENNLSEKGSISKWLGFGNVQLSSLSGEHGVLKVVSTYHISYLHSKCVFFAS